LVTFFKLECTVIVPCFSFDQSMLLGFHLYLCFTVLIIYIILFPADHALTNDILKFIKNTWLTFQHCVQCKDSCEESGPITYITKKIKKCYLE
jgi:hypothetical protein